MIEKLTDFILRIFLTARAWQLFFYATIFSSAALAAAPKSVQLDELTSTEVRELINAGTSTILIPIGGTEQTGPYVALGKHNFRVRELASQIALKAGNALVAPVVSYVPEGSINPPVGHMRFVGTISIPDAAFDALLIGAARSFRQHGFKNIVFLGDHGGYRLNLQRVAQQLNREWAKDTGMHAIDLAQYYQLSSAGFDALLSKRGYSAAQIGTHGGLADTALTEAIDKNLVRTAPLTSALAPAARDGISGDPRAASVELGQAGVQLIVDGSVAALNAARRP